MGRPCQLQRSTRERAHAFSSDPAGKLGLELGEDGFRPCPELLRGGRVAAVARPEAARSFSGRRGSLGHLPARSGKESGAERREGGTKNGIWPGHSVAVTARSVRMAPGGRQPVG
jgi:hypothetical protein